MIKQPMAQGEVVARVTHEPEQTITVGGSHRRDLLVGSLIASLALACDFEEAAASKLDPKETIIRLPDQIAWQAPRNFPEHSVEMAPLFGSTTGSGLYYVLAACRIEIPDHAIGG